MSEKIKHLEFIQGVIRRLSDNSFLLKGWSVVLVSALFALSTSVSNMGFILLAYFPAIMFWGLDGYFLSLERIYRIHYDNIRIKKTAEIDFSMDTSYIPNSFKNWASAVLSISVSLFYCVLIIAIIVVMFTSK